MKYFYIVVQNKNEYAHIERVSTSINLASLLKKYDTANICESKKQAEAIVEHWNTIEKTRSILSHNKAYEIATQQDTKSLDPVKMLYIKDKDTNSTEIMVYKWGYFCQCFENTARGYEQASTLYNNNVTSKKDWIPLF